jgi:hypothetical protein
VAVIAGDGSQTLTGPTGIDEAMSTMARDASGGGRLLLTAVAAGLVAGVATFLLGGFAGGLVYQTGGGAWLIMAAAIMLPGVAAAGCGTIVLHYRSHPRWLRLTAALVAIEAGISLVIAQALLGAVSQLAVVRELESRMVPLGPVDAAAGIFVLLAGLVAIAAVPVLAGALVPQRPPPRSRPWHLAAGAGWLAATTLSYLAGYALLIRAG